MSANDADGRQSAGPARRPHQGDAARRFEIVDPEKGYDAITISDVCDAGNVGRSTFYTHFASKDDLKWSALDRLRRLPIDRQRAAHGADRKFAFSLPMFEHARDHIDLYRAQVGGHGGAVALESIRRMLSELVREELAAADGKGQDAARRELVVQYLVGAYMSVLRWWLDDGAKLPPQRGDAMFRRLAIEGAIGRLPETSRVGPAIWPVLGSFQSLLTRYLGTGFRLRACPISPPVDWPLVPA